MNDPILKLQILVRSEMALLRIQAQRRATQSVLFAIALVFALLALGMLNFAGYQALAEIQSPAIAALLIAVIDGVLALIMVAVSRGAGPNPEQEKVVRDMRDLAYNELNADFDEVKARVSRVTEDVNRIRSSFSAFTSGSAGIANNLAPLLGLLVSAIKNSRSK